MIRRFLLWLIRHYELPVGIQGPPGERGPIGPRGETGPQGARGAQGLPGDRGAQGETGPQGARGERGEQGPVGHSGEQGITGPQGERGPAGAQGMSGRDGKAGLDGKDGKDGKDGATRLGRVEELENRPTPAVRSGPLDQPSGAHAHSVSRRIPGAHILFFALLACGAAHAQTPPGGYASGGTTGSGSGIPYGTGGGTAQAQTVTTTPNITTLTTGTFVTWLPVAANTAAAPTLAAGTTAATAITKCGTVALIPGDLLSTVWAVAQYDGTEWVLQNPIQAGCAEGGLPTSGGTANAQTLTVSPIITAYASGMVFNFTPGIANTGATTIAISGLGTKSVTKCGTTALVLNDLTTTALAVILYDGTEFQLLNPQATGCGAAAAVVNPATPLPTYARFAYQLPEFTVGHDVNNGAAGGDHMGSCAINGTFAGGGVNPYPYCDISTTSTINTPAGQDYNKQNWAIGSNSSQTNLYYFYKGQPTCTQTNPCAAGQAVTTNVRWWAGISAGTQAANAATDAPANTAAFWYCNGASCGSTPPVAANIACVTVNSGGTANRVDTGIAFSVSHLFEILVNDATGAYTFKIDGASVCSSPITTDAPAVSTQVYPQWGGENLTAVAVFYDMTFWGIESLQ